MYIQGLFYHRDTIFMYKHGERNNISSQVGYTSPKETNFRTYHTQKLSASMVFHIAEQQKGFSNTVIWHLKNQARSSERHIYTHEPPQCGGLMKIYVSSIGSRSLQEKIWESGHTRTLVLKCKYVFETVQNNVQNKQQ